MSGGNGREVIVYEAPGGVVRVAVRLEQSKVWPTEARMAKRFGLRRSVTPEHIQNDFKDGELVEGSNVHFLHIAASPNAVGRGGNAKRSTKASSRNNRILSERGLGAIQQSAGSGLPAMAATEKSSVVRVEGSRGSRIRRCASRRLPERGTGDVEQFTSSKLGAAATTKEFLAVQTAGSRPVNRSPQSFDLDAVLTVGYRGKSLRGTQLPLWTTRILREHLLPLPTSREHRGPRTDAFIKVTA